MVQVAVKGKRAVSKQKNQESREPTAAQRLAELAFLGVGSECPYCCAGALALFGLTPKPPPAVRGKEWLPPSYDEARPPTIKVLACSDPKCGWRVLSGEHLAGPEAEAFDLPTRCARGHSWGWSLSRVATRIDATCYQVGQAGTICGDKASTGSRLQGFIASRHPQPQAASTKRAIAVALYSAEEGSLSFKGLLGATFLTAGQLRGCLRRLLRARAPIIEALPGQPLIPRGTGPIYYLSAFGTRWAAWALSPEGVASLG